MDRPDLTDDLSGDLTHGPIEVVVLAFDGEQVGADVRAALADVIDRGAITLLDLTFVARGTDGTVRLVELEEDDLGLGLVDLTIDEGLLSEDDLLSIAQGLEPGTSAAAMVFEHRWARDLATAVLGAGGRVVLDARIPREVADAAFA